MKAFVTSISIVLLLATLDSCTSRVQTRFNPKIPKKLSSSDSNRTEIIIDQTPPKEIVTIPQTTTKTLDFDTLVIDLTQHETIPSEISRGNELFANKDYKSAIQVFNSYINRISKPDYFFWYARFRIAMCFYEMKQIDMCLNELVDLYHSEDIDNKIKEVVVYNIGKIFCETENTEQARFYFNLLAKEFPNSKYLSVENCK
ncbi:MAG: tetratricopeptide repeat protein [Candidatus Kapaibacteriota bacterium]